MVSYRKVGGLHFIKLGRITLMFCVSRADKAPIRVVPVTDHIGEVKDYAWVPRRGGYHDR